MSRVNQQRLSAAPAAPTGTEFSVSKQQIELTADPWLSVKALLGSAPQPQRLRGRPWYARKPDPDLARYVNDQLTGPAN